MKKITFILMLSILCMNSCNKKDDKIEDLLETKESFLPFIKVGAKWTYDVYSNLDPEVVLTEIYEIKDEFMEGWYSVDWTISYITTINIFWYADDIKFSNQCSPPSFILSLYEKDGKVGDEYIQTFDVDNGSVTNKREILAVDQSVITPAGTFTGCIKIRETTSEDVLCYQDYWVHPEKGIVKYEGTTTEDYPEIMIHILRSTNI